MTKFNMLSIAATTAIALSSVTAFAGPILQTEDRIDEDTYSGGYEGSKQIAEINEANEEMNQAIEANPKIETNPKTALVETEDAAEFNLAENMHPQKTNTGLLEENPDNVLSKMNERNEEMNQKVEDKAETTIAENGITRKY